MLIKVKIEGNIFFIVVTTKKLGILLRPAQTSKRGIKSIWESFEGNILAWIIDYLRTLVE